MLLKRKVLIFSELTGTPVKYTLYICRFGFVYTTLHGIVSIWRARVCYVSSTIDTTRLMPLCFSIILYYSSLMTCTTCL